MKKPIVLYFAFLLSVCLCWALGLHFFSDKTSIWNYLYNIAYGLIYLSGGVAGIVYGIRLGWHTPAGKPFILIGSGLISWSIGLVIWVYYNLVLLVEVPYPSITDVFFALIFYPVVTAGCLFFIRLFSPNIPKRYYLESLGITIVAGVIVFSFFSTPDLSQELSFMTKFLNIAYPMGDVILLSVVGIALRVYRGHIPPPLLILISGLLFQTAADFTFSYRVASGAYWNGDISDALFTLAGFILSMGIVSAADSLASGSAKKINENI